MCVAIAIDGPAGAGKTTQAKALAKALGYTYVDTGALYRALAVHQMEMEEANKMQISTEELLRSADIHFGHNAKGDQRVYLCGKDVTNELRTPEVSMRASDISAIPEVRKFLLNMQQEIAKTTSVVMEGRDIGTVVLPDAEHKFFLTANPLIRAYRRRKELLAKGSREVDIDPQKLLNEIMQRDYNDSHREVAPLKKAETAIMIDCSELSISETTTTMLACIRIP